MKSYSGIGSRKTSPEILMLMTDVATFLEKHGYVLYSGGAHGADTAFEAGVFDPAMKKIFLPWKKFNNHSSSLCEVGEEALVLAEKFHPSWKWLSGYAKKLIARDGYQVLGEDLKSPVELIICYTPNGKFEGGTGQAMRIALYHGISIFNLYYDSDRDHVQEWIKSNKIDIKKKVDIESWKLI
jgi:hypothetical protein